MEWYDDVTEIMKKCDDEIEDAAQKHGERALRIQTLKYIILVAFVEKMGLNEDLLEFTMERRVDASQLGK